MRVLIVDDTTFMRATIRRVLEEQGRHDIFEAENGLEAVSKYKIVNPHLVIMDISMPVMDGIEAVKLIKAYDNQANIIICSLQGQRENVMEAIKAGAKSFLVKPIKREKLFAEMAKLPLTSKLDKNSTKSESLDLKAFEDLTPEEMDERIALKLQEANALTNSIEEEKKSEEYLAGVEMGYLEARREITVNMLKLGIDFELIKNCVEVSEEDIENYKIEYKLL